MSEMWARLVRWLAREHIAYLEYENKELRYEGERWRHRCEGLTDALRVFEARHNYLVNAVADAELLNPRPRIIVKTGTVAIGDNAARSSAQSGVQTETPKPEAGT